MSNLLFTLTSLLKDCLKPGGDPPLPTVLEGAEHSLDSLDGAASTADPAGIEKWFTTFKSLITDQALRETLAIRVVQIKLPRVAESLALFGVIGLQPDPADDHKVRSFSIKWDVLKQVTEDPGGLLRRQLADRIRSTTDIEVVQALLLLFVTSPDELVALEYVRQGFLSLSFGAQAPVSLTDLLDNINSPITLTLPITPPLSLADVVAKTKQVPPPPPFPSKSLSISGPNALNTLDGLGLEVRYSDPAAVRNVSITMGAFDLSLDTSATGPFSIGFEIVGNTMTPKAGGSADLSLLLSKTPVDGMAFMLGDLKGTYFGIKTIKVGVTLHFDGEARYGVVFHIDPIEFGVAPGFLKLVSFGNSVPASLKFTSAIETSFLQGKGLSSKGQNVALGIEFTKNLGLNLGGPGAKLSVDTMTTRVEVAVSSTGILFRVSFTYGAKAEVGPLKATMQGAGVWFGRWTSGNAGVIPPSGIGIVIAAGPVNGGGFVGKVSPDEFGGALQLKVLGIGAFAYGLYRTLPDGTVAFVALIGIRLPVPGIQIGFGFAVSGFGGLVGINRRADTDLLRQRLTSGAAGDVLFNENPMKDAPKLLGQMKDLFPPQEGSFLIGPTLQLNWMSLFTLDVGVFIEFPGPTQIFVAGSARLVIGSEDFALVYLRLDFIGGVDFSKSLIFFDGALVNSQVLGFISITGGLALRMAYGENGYFLFSVGGFYPTFNPAGIPLPQLARAGAGFNLAIVWFKQETYLAITSNTFQFGSNTEAGVEIGPFSAHGWFRFDALIQFHPFHFEAGVDAGFDIEFDGVSFASVRVSGTLSGPGPLVLHAEASVRIIIKISKSVTITIDDTPAEELNTIPNVAALLGDEIGKAANVRVDGSDPSVLIKASGAGAMLSPVGDLVWEQKRVPLEVELQRAEGVNLVGPHKVSIFVTNPGLTADPPAETDLFGLGTYLKLSDSQALNAPPFSSERSGVRIKAGQADPLPGAPSVACPVTLSLMRMPERRKWVLGDGFTMRIGDGLAAVLGDRYTGGTVATQMPVVHVHDEAWSTLDGSTMATGLTAGQAVAASTHGGITAIPGTADVVSLAGVM